MTQAWYSLAQCISLFMMLCVRYTITHAPLICASRAALLTAYPVQFCLVQWGVHILQLAFVYDSLQWAQIILVLEQDHTNSQRKKIMLGYSTPGWTGPNSRAISLQTQNDVSWLNNGIYGHDSVVPHGRKMSCHTAAIVLCDVTKICSCLKTHSNEAVPDWHLSFIHC